MKIIFTLLLTTLVYCSHAQTNRAFPFKKGDEFTKQVLARSNCVLQRGSQTLSISSHSITQKLYSVDNVAGADLSFNITTQNIVDTIDAMGQQLAYNTDNPADPGSSIEKALKGMTAKPAMIMLSKGLVSSVNTGGVQYNSDTLLSFAGLQPEQFYRGGSIGLTADIPVNPIIKKGYTWSDSSVTNGRKTVTTFVIDEVTTGTTSLSFSTTIFDTYVNTNINGALVADNYSGIILSRQMQSVSVGYEQINGLVYSATRKSTVTESCYKKM